MANLFRCNLRPFILILAALFLHTQPAVTFPPPFPEPRHIFRRDEQEASEEVMCYALPFGGIGFLSHLLNYYSIICIGYGVKPLLPVVPLSHGTFDLMVSICTLLGSCIDAIVVMARCRQEWQYLLIALWKLGLSLTMGCMCIHRALLVQKSHRGATPFSWLGVYVITTVIGLAGLFSLVRGSWDDRNVRSVTGAFWGIAGVLAFISALFPREKIWESKVEREREGVVAYIQRWFGQDTRETYIVRHESRVWECLPALQSFLGTAVVLTGIFAVLYSDWALGVITGNLAGAPSRDIKAIYWTYFVAKRLPVIFQ